MPETVHIRIEGGRGVGKTTIALAVAAFLRTHHALDVEVVGYSAADTAWLKRVLQDRLRDPFREPVRLARHHASPPGRHPRRLPRGGPGVIDVDAIPLDLPAKPQPPIGTAYVATVRTFPDGSVAIVPHQVAARDTHVGPWVAGVAARKARTNRCGR